MAMEDPYDHAPPPSAEQQEPSHQFSLPPYPEMIMAAIQATDEPNGLNKTAISKHIEAAHPTLPPSHATLLSYHLNQMKQRGQLVMVKNNYMRPDPSAPPKRGRGRPPKPRAPVPRGEEAALPPPRPRGRPPKQRDPSASASPQKPKLPSGSGRPRGRPPKRAKTNAVQPSARAQPTGERRGRGRPPKVKQVVAPVGC